MILKRKFIISLLSGLLFSILPNEFIIGNPFKEDFQLLSNHEEPEPFNEDIGRNS